MSVVKALSKRELFNYRAQLKNEIFRSIRVRFSNLAKNGFNQRVLAERLSMDRGLLSRRLDAQNDMRLETLSDLARGLECRIDVRLTPLEDVIALNKSGRLMRAVVTVPLADNNVKVDTGLHTEVAGSSFRVGKVVSPTTGNVAEVSHG